MDGPLETGMRDSSSPLGQRIHLAGVNIEAGHPVTWNFCSLYSKTSGRLTYPKHDAAHAGLASLNSGFKLIDRGICDRLVRHEFSRDESMMGSRKAL